MHRPFILIVDDSPSRIASLTNILGDDYRILTTNSNHTALTLAAATAQPDLILLGLAMAENDHVALCRQLKANSETCSLPVLLMGDLDPPGIEKLGIDLGAADYLSPSCPSTLIKARVSHYIRLQREVRQCAAAFEELQVAGLVYNHIREGMMLTDADNIIVAVNPAFSRMTGYRPAEVLGKKPSILNSGRQDAKFYRAMWQSLEDHGIWSGEVWNRRKNGSEYVELLSIHTIYRDDGSIKNYLALFADITLNKQADEMIWRQTNFDQLTGLINRHMFRERLLQSIKKAHRNRRCLALIFLDIDRFKEVNDSFGHRVGDHLLQEVARRLQNCVGESDAIARLGGDEFTLILEDLDRLDDAEHTAQHILHSLAQPFSLAGETIYVSASIGMTIYPNDGHDIETLLKNADQAMYAAKNQGRNGYRYFTASMQETAQTRMRLIADLRVALLHQQFEVHYQPIIEVKSLLIHKAEALVRWQHPVRGLVSPADFIPLAEETGLIHDLGTWVFLEAVRQLAYWRGQYDIPLQISINKSPIQFSGNHVAHDDWFEYLRSLELPEHSVVVEITESLLLEASSATTNRLLAFRDAGLQVAIDDFGTGYSALSYLKKFDIDYLKIDQSFIQGLAPESDDLALCEAMVMMAHKLGLKVIAEGVETSEQHAMLRDMGCDYGQGYFYSKPLPAAEFGKLLAKDTRIMNIAEPLADSLS